MLYNKTDKETFDLGAYQYLQDNLCKLNEENNRRIEGLVNALKKSHKKLNLNNFKYIK